MKRSLVLVGAVVVLVFWAYSASLDPQASSTSPGRFPIWYGVNRVDARLRPPLGYHALATTDVLAVVIFATYPFWFYAGTELGHRRARVTTAQRSRRGRG